MMRLVSRQGKMRCRKRLVGVIKVGGRLSERSRKVVREKLVCYKFTDTRHVVCFAAVRMCIV